MRIIKITSRPDPYKIPNFPLPFHVRSTGFHRAEANWSEDIAGKKKPFVQLFWTIKGCGEFVLPETRAITKEGDVFFRLPGENHLHRTLGDCWSYYWFTFDGPFAEEFFLSYQYGRDVLHPGECPINLFHEIDFLLHKRTPYAQRHTISVATEILALAGRTVTDDSGHTLVKNFIDLLHKDDVNLQYTINEYARDLGVHRTTLNRLFRHEMGTTPSDYLQEMRVQRAISLLRETDMPVKMIAYECGISNTSYFCRMIRKITGLTPAKYRKYNLIA